MYPSECGVIHHFNNAHGMQISHDPGLHDPDPGPQEKSMKKSCVSFETECRMDAVILVPVVMLRNYASCVKVIVGI